MKRRRTSFFDLHAVFSPVGIPFEIAHDISRVTNVPQNLVSAVMGFDNFCSLKLTGVKIEGEYFLHLNIIIVDGRLSRSIWQNLTYL